MARSSFYKDAEVRPRSNDDRTPHMDQSGSDQTSERLKLERQIFEFQREQAHRARKDRMLGIMLLSVTVATICAMGFLIWDRSTNYRVQALACSQHERLSEVYLRYVETADAVAKNMQSSDAEHVGPRDTLNLRSSLDQNYLAIIVRAPDSVTRAAEVLHPILLGTDFNSREFEAARAEFIGSVVKSKCGV